MNYQTEINKLNAACEELRAEGFFERAERRAFPERFNASSQRVTRASTQAILSSGIYRLYADVNYGDKFSVALGGATDGLTQETAMKNFLTKNIDSSCHFWVSREGHSEKEYDFGEGDLNYFSSRVWPSVMDYFGRSRIEEI